MRTPGPWGSISTGATGLDRLTPGSTSPTRWCGSARRAYARTRAEALISRWRARRPVAGAPVGVGSHPRRGTRRRHAVAARLPGHRVGTPRAAPNFAGPRAHRSQAAEGDRALL